MRKLIIFIAVFIALAAGMADAQRTHRVSIDSTTFIFGQTCFVASIYFDGQIDIFSYYVMENDTVYCKGDAEPGQPPTPKNYIVTPAYPTLGTYWWGEWNGARFYVQDYRNVTVPAGSFPAYVYDVTDSISGEYIGYWWVSDGVGPVGYQRIELDDTLTAVLNNYTVVGGEGVFPLAVSNRWNMRIRCCDVDMTPDAYPVIVPPGGRFGLTGYIGNPFSDPIVVDVWGGVIYQNHFYQQFVYNDIQLDGRESMTAHVRQRVPGYAPQGTYSYIAYCGDRPYIKCDSAAFPFTVSGERFAGNDAEWSIERDSFGEAIIPTEFKLDNAFPNPFNATTTISFDLPRTEEITLNIYNLMGQKIETLVNGRMDAGHHRVQWNASSYVTGVYFCRLAVGDKVFTKRMTLLK
jgi:hypothetical protein